MSWPEKIVPGQQRDTWGHKLRAWQIYAEDQMIGAQRTPVTLGDTTIRGRLYVERETELSTQAWIRDHLLIQDDATVKDFLTVEGRIRGTADDAWRAQEAQEFKVHKGLIVQDDATVKGDIRVDGFGYLHDTEIRNDATIKHNLSVRKINFHGAPAANQGLFWDFVGAGQGPSIYATDADMWITSGAAGSINLMTNIITQTLLTVGGSGLLCTGTGSFTGAVKMTGSSIFIGPYGGPASFKVMRDSRFKDSTFKDKIQLEGGLKTIDVNGDPTAGITTDMTATGMIYRITNGIITGVRQK